MVPNPVIRFTTNHAAAMKGHRHVHGESYKTFVDRSYQYACAQVDPLVAWSQRSQAKAQKPSRGLRQCPQTLR